MVCERGNGGLSISVDGAVRRSTEVPADLVIDNAAPLTVGGKNLKADKDQFHGAVENVFLDLQE